MPKPSSNLPNSKRPSPLAERVRAVGNRRGFFAKSSMAIAGGAALATEQAIAGAESVANRLHAAGDETLRAGLIGCGVRGRIAVSKALNSQTDKDAGKIELVAMADAFPDQLQSAHRGLKGRHRECVNVGRRRFVGLNAYAELLQCDVDLIILATPPVFRPMHFSAAVQSGKHVMLESYVAVDETGIQQVEAAAKMATEKKLVVGGGLPWRHEIRSRDFVRRIHDGAIGRIESIEMHLPAHASPTPRRVESMSRRDFELRNWRSFNWTGGLFDRCDQFHVLDLANWIAQGEPVPPTTIQMGSSQDSQLFDIELHGSEGAFRFRRGQIRDSASRVRWQSDLREPKGGGTQAAMHAIIRAIREGETFDEAKIAISATRSAIMASQV